MSIQLIYIGRQNKNFYREAEDTFIKRIEKYISFNICAITPKRYSKSLSRIDIQKTEEAQILSKVNPKSHIVLLDEQGKLFDSIKFSKYLEKELTAWQHTSFVIGGAEGFSKDFKSKYPSIALSQFTFPHHLARVIFLEQLYRAFTIKNNEPYHNS